MYRTTRSVSHFKPEHGEPRPPTPHPPPQSPYPAVLRLLQRLRTPQETKPKAPKGTPKTQSRAPARTFVEGLQKQYSEASDKKDKADQWGGGGGGYQEIRLARDYG